MSDEHGPKQLTRRDFIKMAGAAGAVIAAGGHGAIDRLGRLFAPLPPTSEAKPAGTATPGDNGNGQQPAAKEATPTPTPAEVKPSVTPTTAPVLRLETNSKGSETAKQAVLQTYGRLGPRYEAKFLSNEIISVGKINPEGEFDAPGFVFWDKETKTLTPLSNIRLLATEKGDNTIRVAKFLGMVNGSERWGAEELRFDTKERYDLARGIMDHSLLIWAVTDGATKEVNVHYIRMVNDPKTNFMSPRIVGDFNPKTKRIDPVAGVSTRADAPVKIAALVQEGESYPVGSVREWNSKLATATGIDGKTVSFFVGDEYQRSIYDLSDALALKNINAKIQPQQFLLDKDNNIISFSIAVSTDNPNLAYVLNNGQLQEIQMPKGLKNISFNPYKKVVTAVMAINGKDAAVSWNGSAWVDVNGEQVWPAVAKMEVDLPIVGKVDLSQYTKDTSLQNANAFWGERGVDLASSTGTVITFRTVEELLNDVIKNKIPEPGGVVMNVNVGVNNSIAERVTDTRSTGNDKTGEQQPVIRLELHKPKTPDQKSTGVIYKGAPLTITWRVPSDAKGGIAPNKLVMVQISDDYHKFITDEQLITLLDGGITYGIYNLAKNALPGIVLYVTP